MAVFLTPFHCPFQNPRQHPQLIGRRRRDASVPLGKAMEADEENVAFEVFVNVQLEDGADYEE